MKTYMEKTAIFDAIMFDGENRHEIIEELKLEKRFVEHWKNLDDKSSYIMIKAPKLDLGMVRVGDWILIEPNNRGYRVIDSETFAEHYRELNEETKNNDKAPRE